MSAREKMNEFNRIYIEEKAKLQKTASLSTNRAAEILAEAKSKWDDEITNINEAIYRLAKSRTIDILK